MSAFIVVNGRRWRTSDPRIPESLRQELVNELMAARRAIRDGDRPEEIAKNRRRVNDAKVALGERGRAWWLPPTPKDTRLRIEAAIRVLLRSRQAGRSICPSDAARIAGGRTWRSLLPTVRDVAVKMRQDGQIEILRRGRVVTEDAAAGVLRYRLKL